MGLAALKQDEFRQFFETLPAVLIQHPSKQCAYYISKDDLLKFKASPTAFASLRPGTVTFSITGEEMVDEVPPFNQDPSDSPDILVRFLRDRTAYLVPHSELQKFRVEQPKFAFGNHYVSFVVPGGMELVEEIPLLRKGLLQSNTG